MNLHRPSPTMTSSSSSADFSSPALPELSIDASLQRLHLEQDISISSASSAALSRAWLRQSQHYNLKRRSSSPEQTPSHYHAPESSNSERNSTFRFPPVHLSQSHSPSGQHVPARQVDEPVLPARPRTSRGLSQPKPFLSSSSRATSIASIAQVDQQESNNVAPRVVFGTPFAASAFMPETDEFRGQQAPSYSGSSRSAVSPRQAHPAPPLHKDEEHGPWRTTIRNEARCPHASPLQRAESKSSPWTILLAPLSKSQSPDDISVQDPRETILLPLQPSMEQQLLSLKTHLSTEAESDNKPGSDYEFDFFLDLSSVSILPVNTMARMTSDSWSLIFDRYTNGTEETKAEMPLPQLFRDTGLPIVALIRYSRTPSCRLPDSASKPYSKSPATLSATRKPCLHNSKLETHDSSPWTRRESEMTVSLTKTGKLGASPSMVPSRSYPGVAPRTPVRKSPLPYSPRTTSFPRDSIRPHLAAALQPIGSPMTYSHSYHELGSRSGDANKLRSLSLAAAHPLGVSEDKPSKRYSSSLKQSWKVVSGLPAQEDQHEPPASQEGASSHRQRYQSSRGSSHKSFPSHTTSLSTHSTRSTSIYSSLSRLRPTSHHDGEQDNDADTEEDDDVGSRFWTHLSSLGEQVSRQKAAAGAGEGGNGRSRNVSVASTASDASVFDFSPLGILVPTEEVNDDEAGGREVLQDTRSLNVSPMSLAVVSGSTSGILGRRRAYSSMVPLTGWRAGDSDLSTAEGQRLASARDLPQVLLLHGRDSSSGNDIHSLDTADLVTPTVSTFQGRARAKSFQPASTTFQPSLSLDTSISRQDVWEEAMHTVTKRIVRSRGRSFQSQRVGGSTAARIPSDTMIDKSGDEGDSERGREESMDNPTTVVDDTWSPDVQSSPLPGLFYDNWVERVDVGIDGDLDRRGSTFRRHDIEADAAPSQAVEPLGTMTRTSSTSSGSTMLGSAGSISSLQVLHESEWPLPQSRPVVVREPAEEQEQEQEEGEETMLSASASFLSVLSPRENDEDELSNALAPTQTESGTGSTSVQLANASIPRISASLLQPSIEAGPGAKHLISSWADLAHRLKSPGSMRLLCLAAANLTPSELPLKADTTGLDEAFDAALTVPTIQELGSLTRSRSLSAVEQPVAQLVQLSKIQVGRNLEPALAVNPNLIQPTTTSTWTNVKALDELHHNTGLGSKPPPTTTRVKRSLSNIFDPPTPASSHTNTSS